jgi:integrase
MARSPRDRFERECDRIAEIDDSDVREALEAFRDVLDPEVAHVEVPQAKNGTVDGHESPSLNTGRGYLSGLRSAHQRGLDLLDADAETVNNFMRDIVTDPERRRYDLVDYDGKNKKSSMKTWQSAVIGFYRFCTEPGKADDRPDVAVEWPADDIIMFSERSDPKHDEEDMPEQSDLDAMREACLHSQNTRRDRAFLELAAGTGQRVYALVTLRLGDVHLDADVPHIMLNPEIADDGDKGAIDNTGRLKPIVSDTGPIQQWIQNHPFQDPDVRAEHGAPDDFEDCYLFVGSLRQRSTDASDHWGTEAARNMLDRRKERTDTMPGVKTVDIPVNPHNWRHYAYTKSKDLDIDESKRRKVFGWKPDSSTGDRIYGHVTNTQASEDYHHAWIEAFGDADTTAVAEQVVGDAIAGDLSPEARTALVQEIVTDDDAMQELTEALEPALADD